MSRPPHTVATASSQLLFSVGALLAAALGAGLFVETVFEAPAVSGEFLSESSRNALARRFGAVFSLAQPDAVDAPLGLFTAGALIVLAMAAVIGAWFRQGAAERRLLAALLPQLRATAFAALPLGAWQLAWFAGVLQDSEALKNWLVMAAPVVAGLSLAGVVWANLVRRVAASPSHGHIASPSTGVTTPSTLAPAGREAARSVPPLGSGPSRRAWGAVAVGMVLYTALMTALNWGLWYSLRLPHGDSAMYEEHLWRLIHGDGFRSDLDQGLFLGEHLQVIHVLLLPVYVLFPTHLTLELLQSLILASGAIPVFLLARRFGGDRAGVLLAGTYLLYFPLHYLDISIDLKTFRPSALGVPPLLGALAAIEAGRLRRAPVWLLIALSAQEDFAIPLCLIGLWTAGDAWRRSRDDPERRARIVFGIVLAAASAAYLWLAVRYIIPWFRGGAPVHFARYFSQFGETPQAIVAHMLSHPLQTAGVMITPGALIYAIYLLAPLGFLPLRAPGRLLVAAPMFLLLCMNDLAMELPMPVHHFHAVIIPILFWAAAASLAPKRRL